METMRRLRQGLRQGAADAELQAHLDALDRIEIDQRAKERELIGEVDQMLTVRQRVELRFDANQGYTVDDAPRFVDLMADAGIELLEQPTARHEPRPAGPRHPPGAGA